MKKMMATLAILIAASTITVNASSKHDNNGRHNNDNVAMMNNDYDRHNDGDRVYNGGRHHRGNKVVIINNYGRRDRDCYMVRHEPPRARFAHHAHPFIGYRISEMPRGARRIYRDHHTYYVYEGYEFNPVVTAAGIIFEAIAVASTR